MQPREVSMASVIIEVASVIKVASLIAASDWRQLQYSF
jgi:hypothetical protein